MSKQFIKQIFSLAVLATVPVSINNVDARGNIHDWAYVEVKDLPTDIAKYRNNYKPHCCQCGDNCIPLCNILPSLRNFLKDEDKYIEEDKKFNEEIKEIQQLDKKIYTNDRVEFNDWTINQLAGCTYFPLVGLFDKEIDDYSRKQLVKWCVSLWNVLVQKYGKPGKGYNGIGDAKGITVFGCIYDFLTYSFPKIYYQETGRNPETLQETLEPIVSYYWNKDLRFPLNINLKGPLNYEELTNYYRNWVRYHLLRRRFFVKLSELYCEMDIDCTKFFKEYCYIDCKEPKKSDVLAHIFYDEFLKNCKEQKDMKDAGKCAIWEQEYPDPKDQEKIVKKHLSYGSKTRLAIEKEFFFDYKNNDEIQRIDINGREFMRYNNKHYFAGLYKPTQADQEVNKIGYLDYYEEPINKEVLVNYLRKAPVKNKIELLPIPAAEGLIKAAHFITGYDLENEIKDKKLEKKPIHEKKQSWDKSDI